MSSCKVEVPWENRQRVTSVQEIPAFRKASSRYLESNKVVNCRSCETDYELVSGGKVTGQCNKPRQISPYGIEYFGDREMRIVTANNKGDSIKRYKDDLNKDKRYHRMNRQMSYEEPRPRHQIQDDRRIDDMRYGNCVPCAEEFRRNLDHQSVEESCNFPLSKNIGRVYHLRGIFAKDDSVARSLSSLNSKGPSKFKKKPLGTMNKSYSIDCGEYRLSSHYGSHSDRVNMDDHFAAGSGYRSHCEGLSERANDIVRTESRRTLSRNSNLSNSRDELETVPESVYSDCPCDEFRTGEDSRSFRSYEEFASKSCAYKFADRNDVNSKTDCDKFEYFHENTEIANGFLEHLPRESSSVRDVVRSYEKNLRKSEVQNYESSRATSYCTQNSSSYKTSKSANYSGSSREDIYRDFSGNSISHSSISRSSSYLPATHKTYIRSKEERSNLSNESPPGNCHTYPLMRIASSKGSDDEKDRNSTVGVHNRPSRNTPPPCRSDGASSSGIVSGVVRRKEQFYSNNDRCKSGDIRPGLHAVTSRDRHLMSKTSSLDSGCHYLSSNSKESAQGRRKSTDACYAMRTRNHQHASLASKESGNSSRRLDSDKPNVCQSDSKCNRVSSYVREEKPVTSNRNKPGTNTFPIAKSDKNKSHYPVVQTKQPKAGIASRLGKKLETMENINAALSDQSEKPCEPKPVALKPIKITSAANSQSSKCSKNLNHSDRKTNDCEIDPDFRDSQSDSEVCVHPHKSLLTKYPRLVSNDENSSDYIESCDEDCYRNFSSSNEALENIYPDDEDDDEDFFSKPAWDQQTIDESDDYSSVEIDRWNTSDGESLNGSRELSSDLLRGSSGGSIAGDALTEDEKSGDTVDVSEDAAEEGLGDRSSNRCYPIVTNVDCAMGGTRKIWACCGGGGVMPGGGGGVVGGGGGAYAGPRNTLFMVGHILSNPI